MLVCMLIPFIILFLGYLALLQLHLLLFDLFLELDVGERRDSPLIEEIVPRHQLNTCALNCNKKQDLKHDEVWTWYSIRILRKENNKNDISVHWPPWKNIPRMHFWRKALNQAKVAFFEWTLQKIFWQFHKWSHTHTYCWTYFRFVNIYIYRRPLHNRPQSIL